MKMDHFVFKKKNGPADFAFGKHFTQFITIFHISHRKQSQEKGTN